MPLLVRIDLIPGGFIEGSHEIARALITREGPIKEDNSGDYRVQLTHSVAGMVEIRRGQARDVKRDDYVWYFLHNLLEQLDTT